MQVLMQLIIILTVIYVLLVLFRSFFVQEDEYGLSLEDMNINYNVNNLNLLNIKRINKDIILNKLNLSNKNNKKINIKGHISSTSKPC